MGVGIRDLHFPTGQNPRGYSAEMTPGQGNDLIQGASLSCGDNTPSFPTGLNVVISQMTVHVAHCSGPKPFRGQL